MHDDHDDVYDQLEELEAMGLEKLADKNDINRNLMRVTVKALTEFRGRRLEPRDFPDVAILYVALKCRTI